MLQETFIDLISRYTSDKEVSAKLWQEIDTAFAHKKRYYHTLAHLENLLLQLTAVKADIADWETTLFTLFYHDIVYNVLKQDNEEQSAMLAGERLRELHVSGESIDKCCKQIMATKSHSINEDNDTNLFTDADLSILGMDWDTYYGYMQNVRKEYRIYPDIAYKPGRKKVMQHFLAMDSIYKTSYFHGKYELQARENIARELSML